MTHTVAVAVDESTSDRLQIIAAIILGLATALTAVSAYKAALLDGDALRGYRFELATVLLALTLFFAGIATLFRQRSVNVALLGVSAVVLLAGSVQLATAF
jgi:hypothetical protein